MSNTRNLGELLQSDGEVPSSKIDSVAASKLTGTVADARLSSTRQAAKLQLSGGALTGAITTNSTFDGRDVGTDGTKLDGIAASANLYVHPNHSGDIVSTADGATVIQVDAVDIPMLSATGTASSTTFLRGDNSWVTPTDTNTTYSVGAGGLTQQNFTTTLKNKLDGIAASATANTGDITGVTAGSGMSGGGTSGTVTLTNAGVTSIVAGSNVSISGATGAVTVTATDTNTMGSGFVLEDGDGTEVTITENKEVKFVEGAGIDINWTDTSNHSRTEIFA